MCPDDPPAEKEAVSASDLEGKPVILPRRQNVQSELSNWFGDSFGKVKVLFTSNLSTNGAIMVQGGLGYSLAIEGSVPFWDKQKITYRPLSPKLQADSAIAWKKQQPFSLAADKFIEYAKCFFSAPILFMATAANTQAVSTMRKNLTLNPHWKQQWGQTSIICTTQMSMKKSRCRE